MRENEKRKKKRFDAKLFVQIRSDDQTDLGRGVMMDVSVGGFRLESEADLETNSIYNFNVEIPLTLRAKVVRREIPGQIKLYGLQFSGLSFFDKFVLRKMLKGTRSTNKI